MQRPPPKASTSTPVAPALADASAAPSPLTTLAPLTTPGKDAAPVCVDTTPHYSPSCAQLALPPSQSRRRSKGRGKGQAQSPPAPSPSPPPPLSPKLTLTLPPADTPDDFEARRTVWAQEEGPLPLFSIYDDSRLSSGEDIYDFYKGELALCFILPDSPGFDATWDKFEQG